MQKHRLRPDDYRWCDFSASKEGKAIIILFWLSVAVIALGCGIAAVIFGIGRGYETDDRTELQDVASVLNKHLGTDTGYREAAEVILDTNERLMEEELGEETVSRLQDVIRTGEPLDTDVEVRSWDYYWSFTVPLIASVTGLTLSLIGAMLYIFYSLGGYHFLADLPWRRFWPFLVVAFLHVWGILFFLGSAFHLLVLRSTKRLPSSAAE